MAVCSISVVPIGTTTPSISQYVADCVRVLDSFKDLKYDLSAMCTIVEGDLDRILEVVKRMHGVPFEKGAQRVLTSLTIDDRQDKGLTIEGKLRAVKEKF